MITYKEVSTVQKVIDDVVCDICKNSCIKIVFNERIMEAAELSVRWGYGSIQDGESYDYHFCEECFNKLSVLIETSKLKELIYECK